MADKMILNVFMGFHTYGTPLYIGTYFLLGHRGNGPWWQIFSFTLKVVVISNLTVAGVTTHWKR
jgi:hypothetical protein